MEWKRKKTIVHQVSTIAHVITFSIWTAFKLDYSDQLLYDLPLSFLYYTKWDAANTRKIEAHIGVLVRLDGAFDLIV